MFATLSEPETSSVTELLVKARSGDGSALADVFPLHGLGPDGQEFPPKTTIQTQLTAQQRGDLLVFLKAIDGTTPHFRSEGDVFRDSVRLQGTCPPPAPMVSATR